MGFKSNTLVAVAQALSPLTLAGVETFEVVGGDQSQPNIFLTADGQFVMTANNPLPFYPQSFAPQSFAPQSFAPQSLVLTEPSTVPTNINEAAVPLIFSGPATATTAQVPPQMNSQSDIVSMSADNVAKPTTVANNERILEKLKRVVTQVSSVGQGRSDEDLTSTSEVGGKVEDVVRSLKVPALGVRDSVETRSALDRVMAVAEAKEPGATAWDISEKNQIPSMVIKTPEGGEAVLKGAGSRLVSEDVQVKHYAVVDRKIHVQYLMAN
eukprot:Blabericola_migrator_1__10720@NODE_612_length_7289_cov_45_683606_g445_i0_p5_GENE_NODE_612_length_7289_cov_45_683606_g445_i0NODE_612_length_7289_cov_45_683606_g445_i0_p5_ORF_typecomplete_len268_score51_50_NODE_612_length_7289_cov_45_683606_g445_i053426145